MPNKKKSKEYFFIFFIDTCIFTLPNQTWPLGYKWQFEGRCVHISLYKLLVLGRRNLFMKQSMALLEKVVRMTSMGPPCPHFSQLLLFWDAGPTLMSWGSFSVFWWLVWVFFGGVCHPPHSPSSPLRNSSSFHHPTGPQRNGTRSFWSSVIHHCKRLCQSCLRNFTEMEMKSVPSGHRLNLQQLFYFSSLFF